MTYWSHGNKIFLGSFSSSFASEKRLLWTKQTRLYELTEVTVLYNFQLGKHALSAKNCHRIFLLYFSFQVIFLFKFYINITIIIMLITGHLSWGLNIIQSNIIMFVCLFAFKCLLLYKCSLHLTWTHHLCFLYQFPWFLLSCQQGPK